MSKQKTVWIQYKGGGEKENKGGIGEITKERVVRSYVRVMT